MRHYNKLILALTLVLGACNGIPSAYVGEYKDNATGLEVDVSSTGVSMKKRNGREVRLAAAELKAEPLLKTKNGAYYVKGATDKDIVDVYVISPNAATKQQAGDIVWFEAELAMGSMDPTVKERVPALTLEYCARGLVQVDVISQAVQLGCPGDAVSTLNLVRTGNGRRDRDRDRRGR